MDDDADPVEDEMDDAALDAFAVDAGSGGRGSWHIARSSRVAAGGTCGASTRSFGRCSARAAESDATRPTAIVISVRAYPPIIVFALIPFFDAPARRPPPSPRSMSSIVSFTNIAASSLAPAFTAAGSGSDETR